MLHFIDDDGKLNDFTFNNFHWASWPRVVIFSVASLHRTTFWGHPDPTCSGVSDLSVYMVHSSGDLM